MADDYGWGVAPRLLLVPVSIVIAWASLRWVEAPFRRRRRDTTVAQEHATTDSGWAAPSATSLPASGEIGLR